MRERDGVRDEEKKREQTGERRQRGCGYDGAAQERVGASTTGESVKDSEESESATRGERRVKRAKRGRERRRERSVRGVIGCSLHAQRMGIVMDQLQPLECVLFSFLCLPRIPGEPLSLRTGSGSVGGGDGGGGGDGSGGGNGGSNGGEPLAGNPGRQPATGGESSLI